MRRRNVKNPLERLESNPDLVILEPTNKLALKQLFSNDNPVYLEIGMGKGDFIIEHALLYPNINFIGLEKYPSVLVQALEKIKNQSITNLKLVVVDANKLTELFDENSISKIFLNFSDPWPKKRHAKRRLTNSLFLKQYQTILKEDGIIEFKTDNQSLFEYSLVEMNNYPLKFLDLSLDLHHRDETYIIKTEYEKKFIAKGNNIYFLKGEFINGNNRN